VGLFYILLLLFQNISVVQKELEQRIKSLESELKQSKEEAARLRSESTKVAATSDVPDFSDRVKELEEK
jgi:predicted Holliday junction resolvase-like endonuclease